jgi:hypothetical protein
MTRPQLGLIRVLAAASAAFSAIACNSILGIEEPLQPPPSDAAAEADAEPNGDAGPPDVSVGDAEPEDVETRDAREAEAESAAPDVLPDVWPVDDASADTSIDTVDAFVDVADDTDLSDAPDGDTGRGDGSTDVRTDGDAGRVDAPRPDAPRVDVRRPDGSAPPEITLVLTIADDQDDATWINNTDERLHYDMVSLYIEVGADAEAGKAGLRFKLPVPPGSVVNSATIELQRTIGDALANESMKVQVYDSANVPPFDDAHTHGPEGHAAGGLWPTEVGPIWVGENGNSVQTSEIKHLVQHVIDRPDWVDGAAIGFVFSAQAMGVRWVSFADSSLKAGPPSLHIVYTPPR